MKKKNPQGLLEQAPAGNVIYFDFRKKNYIAPPPDSQKPSIGWPWSELPNAALTGWPRTCVECSHPFVLDFVACTVRDGREWHCPLCVARGTRHEG